MKTIRWLLLIGILLLVVAPIPALAVVKSSSPRTIVIKARQFSYSPNVIRVQQGQRVKLILEAEDVSHGLILDAYDVVLEAAPRQEKESSVEFVADRRGTFRMRCTVVCGPLHPFMIGEFIVEPDYLSLASFPLLLGTVVGTMGFLWRRRDLPLPGPRDGWRFELTRFRPVKWFVKQRWFQYALFVPNTFFFAIIMLAAFFGTPVGNANFAIIFVWIVWWALLKLVFIPLGGRSWCTMCPIPAPAEWLDHRTVIAKGKEQPLSVATKNWPKSLKNVWMQNGTFMAVALFSAIILTRPWATGVVLLAFFVGAIWLSKVYGRRIFCRYVCPVGGFIGVYSMVAPIELRVKEPEVCIQHKEKECIRGSEKGYGCPWLEYPGTLDRNVNCGICTECIKTCPKDNVAINLRPFGKDLFTAKGRSLDEIYNTFIMLTCAVFYSAVYLGPWGALKDMANIASIPSFLLYSVIFIAANLVIVPGLYYLAVLAGKTFAEGRMPSRQEVVEIFQPVRALPGQIAQLVKRALRRTPAPTPAAVAATTPKAAKPRPAAGALPPMSQLFVDFGYALVPLGLTGWIAFTVSFVLIDISYAIPLLSDPFGWGWNLFGTAGMPWIRFIPRWVPYIQTPILLTGMALSIIVAYRIVRGRVSDKLIAWKSATPVAVFIAMVTAVLFQLYL
jgi:polyferredoxin